MNSEGVTDDESGESVEPTEDVLYWLAALDSLLPAVALSANNLRQVVHTHMPLSPSSIIWYQSKGGDALRLGR